MRPGTPGFEGERLREAREARGLTQIALADMLGVSTQSVSQYEKGLTSPRPDVMSRLPSILNLPAEYFFEPAAEGEEETTVFYRSMSAATSRLRDRAEQKYNWLKRIVDYLSQFVELPASNFPSCNYSPDPLQISSEDIERAAASLREYWGLGQGPISNVVYLLENNGAVAARMQLAADTLDAFSRWRIVDTRPYMVLGSDKGAAARSRYDAAHELGHMILHRNVPKSVLRRSPEFKEMETQAHRFAGAFLLPATSFVDEFVTPSLDTFLRLKVRWNVSVAAMLKRSADLGLLRPEQESVLWRLYSRRGYRKGEPLDRERTPEEPELLKQSFRLLLEQSLQTRGQILKALPFSESDLEELACLPTGYLSDHPKVRVLGQPQDGQDQQRPAEGRAKVIPFPRSPLDNA